MEVYGQVVLPVESILGGVFGSVLENILGAYMEEYDNLSRVEVCN
jgi:hypothetical protein